MPTTNQTYLTAAIEGALADFHAAAGPGHINDPLFALSCRLVEFANAAPDVLSEMDAEQQAGDAARTYGHDEQSIRATWRSALRHVGANAAHIPDPAIPNGHAPAGFANLAAFEQARGLPAGTLAAMGWSDAELYEYEYTDKQGKPATALTDQERLVHLRRRRALRFETPAGPRWRLIDADQPKPKYWHPIGTHTDATKTWYRLADALALAAQVGYLVLCNGEIAACVAQHYGVPATCETGGGEKLTPPHLLAVLQLVWAGPVLIPADCDQKGHKAASAKAEQYQKAGWASVRAIDLHLGVKEDLADFCRLHQTQSVAHLPLCSDLPSPGQAGSTSNAARTQSQEIIDQLIAMGYTFRLNLCGNLIEVNGETITDTMGAVIRTRLRDAGRKLAPVEDAYTAHAVANAYHPIKDYLQSLAWDGQERIAQLAGAFTGDNPIVIYQDGSTCALESVYWHRWLIGAVAKVFEQAQNAMLVFTGEQGTGKSTLARWLCPPELVARHFIESSINTRDKDSYIRLMQMFLWEVGELDATTRKQDVAELKQFISERIVTVRRSYGRYDTQGPALASLIGTVNSQEFLADETGNRRFYVIDVQGLDWHAYQQLDVAQIWAEAVARYRRGEPWRLLPEESAVQTVHNRGYMGESLIDGWIRKHIALTGDPDHTMTAADIIDHLRSKDIKPNGTDRAIAMDIARSMAALGVKRVRTTKARYYEGIMPKL